MRGLWKIVFNHIGKYYIKVQQINESKSSKINFELLFSGWNPKFGSPFRDVAENNLRTVNKYYFFKK